MRHFFNLTATAALTGTLFIASLGPASASVDLEISEAVRSVAGQGSNVRVDVDGSTVTLTGFVVDANAVSAIEQAAEEQGAAKVINNVFPIN